MTESVVLYEVDEKVSVITMNRPDKLNAITPALKAGLMEAFRRADEDPATSVVLLQASGRSFCVGYDIVEGDAERESWRHDAIKWHEYLSHSLKFEFTPWDLKKPVIASVQGHALGGGCELAMMCDLTIASDKALFGEPEVRFSTVGPGLVMPWFVGLKKARELLYFGDMIDASTALELGMINRIVPLEELPAAARKYAKRLALISPEVLALTKLAISRGAEAAGFRSAVNLGLDIVAPLYAAQTEAGMKFKDITDKEGLGAALKWRGGQFKE
jgi:enoyl-CoA hydratase